MPELTLLTVTGVEFSLWESSKLVGLAAVCPWVNLWLPRLEDRAAQPACFLCVQVRCAMCLLRHLFVVAGEGDIIRPWLAKLFPVNNWALCFGSELCHMLVLILKSFFSEMHLSLITVSKWGKKKGWVLMKQCHNRYVNKEIRVSPEHPLFCMLSISKMPWEWWSELVISAEQTCESCLILFDLSF